MLCRLLLAAALVILWVGWCKPFPCRRRHCCQKHCCHIQPKARLTLALDISTGKKFHILITPDVGEVDLDDVTPVFVSSDETLATVGPDDATPPNPLRATVITVAAGDVTITATDADADADPGEVRPLSATFDLHIVQAVVEPTSIGLAVDGPIVDA